MDQRVEEKHRRLSGIFRSMGRVLVAYSGGVDSTLLLKVAQDSLGSENTLAATALSPLYPEREVTGSKRITESLGVRHVLIESNELEIDGFSKNPPNRCYFCKRELFKKLCALAKKEGISFVVEGSTVDDEKDHRPGRLAVQELGVRSPLKEVGLTKVEIREEITPEGLKRVGEAEDFLFSLGFKQVRVRHYGPLARIELLKEEMGRLIDSPLRDAVVSQLKEMGYQYVTLDLQGFRSGSMNEVL
jgi:uncharacterized protein